MKKLMSLLLAIAAISCARKENDGQKLLALNEDFTEVTIAKNESPYATLYGAWTGKLASAYNADKDQTISYTITRLDDKHHTITANRTIDGESETAYGKFSEKDGKISMSFDFWADKMPQVQKLTFENGVLKAFAPLKRGHLDPVIECTMQRSEFKYDPLVTTDSAYFVDFENPKKVEKKLKPKKVAKVEKKAVDKLDADIKFKEGYVRPSYPMTTEAVFGINASAKLLKESELKNLKKSDLQFLKNTIYARHGYIFKSDALNDYFTQFSWYVPTSSNVEVTEIEQKNVKLLTRYEKYAEEYYEYFGR